MKICVLLYSNGETLTQKEPAAKKEKNMCWEVISESLPGTE